MILLLKSFILLKNYSIEVFIYTRRVITLQMKIILGRSFPINEMSSAARPSQLKAKLNYQ